MDRSVLLLLFIVSCIVAGIVLTIVYFYPINEPTVCTTCKSTSCPVSVYNAETEAAARAAGIASVAACPIAADCPACQYTLETQNAAADAAATTATAAGKIIGMNDRVYIDTVVLQQAGKFPTPWKASYSAADKAYNVTRIGSNGSMEMSIPNGWTSTPATTMPTDDIASTNIHNCLIKQGGKVGWGSASGWCSLAHYGRGK